MYRLVHIKKNKYIPGECPRLFFDSDREISDTSSMCHCEDLTLLFFLSDFSPGESFFENVAHLRLKSFGEKKKTEVRHRDGHEEHVQKFQGLSLKNSMNI